MSILAAFMLLAASLSKATLLIAIGGQSRSLVLPSTDGPKITSSNVFPPYEPGDPNLQG